MSNTSKPAKIWRLGVLISGSGSNLQALIDLSQKPQSNIEIVAVASNKPDAYGLTRAKNAGIETLLFDPAQFENRLVMCSTMAKALKERQVDLVCLAGYLLKLEPCMIRSFPNRIINIHPSLLPKFGGKGMFGLNVHKAVIDAGETESGATVHMVDEIFDNGAIIQQVKVDVQKGDTPEVLARRILPNEHEIYAHVVKDICSGKIDLDKLNKKELI